MSAPNTLTVSSALLAVFCFASSSASGQTATVDPTVRTEGVTASSVLDADVTISYDRFGVPTVESGGRFDAYFAEGFLHAQNRFAQMDLSRRFAAGELAALIGPSMVEQDRASRRFRLRTVARDLLGRLDDDDRQALSAYTAGVNAGLADLVAPAPEYAILGATPSQWVPEDSVLVMFAFMLTLDWSASWEGTHASFFEAVPASIREFLVDPRSRQDAPITELRDRRNSIPGIPTDEQIALRILPEVPETIEHSYGGPDDSDGIVFGDGKIGNGDGNIGNGDESDNGNEDGNEDVGSDAPETTSDDSRDAIGSNQWAIGADLTADGRAILANDPHLGLTLPVAWYRIRLLWPEHDLTGLSIPGLPGISIGSNGKIAWGFTNLTGDLQDLIALEIDPDDPDRYRTSEGWESFGEVVEMIEVAGGESVAYPIRTTRWGLVNGTYQDASGASRDAVVEWAALHPELINIDIFKLEESSNVEEALDVVGGWYGPAQNVVVADSAGNIGFTVSGFLPDRRNKDGRAPYGLWDGTESWSTRPSAKRPRVVNPASGFLHTANNRTADLMTSSKLGFRWANPSRARRIADVLMVADDADEPDMLDLQMDTTVLAYEPWRDLIVLAISVDEPDEDLARVRAELVDWNGKAEGDQVAPALIGWIRSKMLRDIRESVELWAMNEGLGRVSVPRISDEPYLRLIEDQPMNWLPEGPWDSWDEWITIQILAAIEEGVESPWEESNRIMLESPLASMAPDPMKPMLQIDLGPQSGHWFAPKVLTPGIGASARMVVSPGREADGILLTPGGQSGNPLSPHYRSLTDSWTQGDLAPFLPGEPVATFDLRAE